MKMIIEISQETLALIWAYGLTWIAAWHICKWIWGNEHNGDKKDGE